MKAIKEILIGSLIVVSLTGFFVGIQLLSNLVHYGTFIF